MRIHAFALAGLLLATLPAGVAAAEAGTLTIPAFRDSTVLVLNLRRGEVLDIAWSASASVEFRVEAAGLSDGLLRHVDRAGEGTFTAPADGAFDFSFENGNLFQVTVSWSIARRADAAPWIIGGVSALLVALAGVAVWRERQHTWTAVTPRAPPNPPSD